MWLLFQSVIMFAVMASNIAYKWTPNPYLAGVIGCALAFGATVAISELLTWARKQSNSQSRQSRARLRR